MDEDNISFNRYECKTNNQLAMVIKIKLNRKSESSRVLHSAIFIVDRFKQQTQKIVKVKPLYKQTGVHDRKTSIQTTKITTSYRKKNKTAMMYEPRFYLTVML